MNVTVYPNALRFFAQHDSYVVDNLHRQYLGLVELLESSPTVIAEPCDYIVERVIEVVGYVPKIPEYNQVFISQVGDSLVFVFLKDRITYINTWDRKNITDWGKRIPVYAVIFTGLSNIKKESSDDK